MVSRSKSSHKPVLAESPHKPHIYSYMNRVSLTPAGQLSQVGRQFYSTDIEVEILSKEETEKMTYVVCTREEGGFRSSISR